MGKDAYGDCIHIREYKMRELVEKIIENSGGKVSQDSIKVCPCWFGVLCLNVGLTKLPTFLNNFCHFFFIKFKKHAKK